MGRRDIFFFSVVLGGAAILAAGSRSPSAKAVDRRPVLSKEGADLRGAAGRVDRALATSWPDPGPPPTAPALELAVMRRLSLALTGSIPSIEEIRRFEARPESLRIDAYLDDLLADRRTADYLAERLARAYVGTEDGPFLLFRRRRFTTWLSDAILAGRPYDAIVRDLIAASGVWTDHPAANFITVTRDMETERPDPERLAARTARAFLGVRLDCAQCHDHPFQPWKQGDFRGLAAFFGGLRADLRGVRDAETTYKPADRKTREPVDVEPSVPFLADLLPEVGGPRDRLAAWVGDPRNPNLARATANRFWALMFGRPLVEPVDDLPDESEIPEALTALADDFAGHGFDLRRLVRVLAATDAFRRDSANDSEGEAGLSPEQDATWAAFPMTRLRPEQVAGALFQAASLPTLDGDLPWIVRFANFNGRNDFVRRYGDLGADEFDGRAGTIPQRLLLMNGELVRERTKDDLFNAATRIAEQAPTAAKAVEVAFLAVLTRRPTEEESDHFVTKLAGTTDKDRKDRLTDLFWTLLNTTEFSWNH